MIKLTRLILISVLVFALSACGSAPKNKPEESHKATTEPTVNELEQIQSQLADVQWTLEDGVLTISGMGAMPDYDMHSANNEIEMEVESPWFDRRLEIRSIVIGEGITYVGAWAFSACDNLTEITFPSTLVGFGYGAMGGNSIEQIVFPDHIKFLGEGMMADCQKLKKITIGSGVKTIPYAAFYKCHFLQEVQLSEGLQTIGEDAFYECKQLHTINFPESLKRIGESAFTESWNLRSVVLPDHLATIDSYCFYHSGLEEVALPADLQVIRVDTFTGCDNLKKVVLPVSLKEVERYAFSNCYNLEEVVYPSGALQWASVTVDSKENGLFLQKLYENLAYTEGEPVTLDMDYRYTGGRYNNKIHYRIPRLNLAGEGAAAINNEINNSLYDLATSCISCCEDNGWCQIGSISCRYKIANDILSLKVLTQESESAIQYYYEYAIRMSDGARLTKWDVLDAFGIDAEEFERKVAGAIQKYLDDRSISLDQDMLDRTLDSENLKASMVYIGENLKIEVVAKIFVPAGSGYSYVVLSI